MHLRCRYPEYNQSRAAEARETGKVHPAHTGRLQAGTLLREPINPRIHAFPLGSCSWAPLLALCHLAKTHATSEVAGTCTATSYRNCLKLALASFSFWGTVMQTQESYKTNGVFVHGRSCGSRKELQLATCSCVTEVAPERLRTSRATTSRQKALFRSFCC
eukprot:5439436-Amphidinium_carterae.1